ncbi:MAG TPA: choice-of-anchor D domain-containing protein, partial [Candidatus Kapabacteria bacterium]
TISLSGKGIDSKLIVEPNALNFGELDTMTISAPQSFTIKNGGTAPTTINSIVKTGSSTFTMNVDKSTPFSLAPDSMATVTVIFAPTLVQTESGTITFTASEGSPIDVALTGTGKEVPIVSVSEVSSFRFSMSISPNPAREYAALLLTSERAATINIVIIDMNGKIAINLANERVTEGKNSMNVITSGLAQGMYLVRIYENGALLDEENMAIIR